MPELPEVETMKRDLARKIIGQTITKIDIYDPRVIHTLSARQFKSRLIGKKISDVTRRAKAVIIHFADQTYLIVQVKMTGFFVVGPHLREGSESKDTKVVFMLSDGQYLNYNDQRLFGWLIYTEDLKKIKYLQSVGPEPLESGFELKVFQEKLHKRKVPIKTLLMDQSFVAGIGNIYASEILFQARVNPLTPAEKLSIKQIQKIHQSIQDILTKAIALRGTSMRNYRDSLGQKGQFMNLIQVYGKAAQPCPVCAKLITRIVQAQRSTFYCEHCQSV